MDTRVLPATRTAPRGLLVNMRGILATRTASSWTPTVLVVAHDPPMARAPKQKAIKLGRALKTAARLPARVSGGRGSGRNTSSPQPGEAPVVVLRVQILGCTDLISKDKNGLSDPYVLFLARPLHPLSHSCCYPHTASS